MWLMELKWKIKYDRAAREYGSMLPEGNKTDAKISASNGI